MHLCVQMYNVFVIEIMIRLRRRKTERNSEEERTSGGMAMATNDSERSES